MSMNTPNILQLPPKGIWLGRNVHGIFLKRHNAAENVEAARSVLAERFQNTNPGEQLFLVEGHGRYLTFENKLLRDIALARGVQVFDPIVNPFTSDIADGSSVDRVKSAVSVLVFDYLEQCFDGDKNANSGCKKEEIIRRAAESTAKDFGVPVKSVLKEFSTLSLSHGALLQERLVDLFNARKKLINTSNLQSRQGLLEVLDKNDQPNVFIMAGGEHDEVFIPDLAGSNQTIFSSGVRAAHWDNPWHTTPSGAPVGELAKLVADQQAAARREAQRPVWERFESAEYGIETALSKKSQTSFMLELLAQGDPKPLKFHLYSNSQLMKLALADPDDSKGIWDLVNRGRISQDIRGAAIDAGKILRIVVERIGNELPDAGEIVAKLLKAHLKEVREEAVTAISSTKRHNWRKNNSSVENILLAVKSLSNPALENRVVSAIISANPAALFFKKMTSDEYLIFNGKNEGYERILLECAKDSDREERALAYYAIRKYIELHKINSDDLDSVLMKGLENQDPECPLVVGQRIADIVAAVNKQPLLEKPPVPFAFHQKALATVNNRLLDKFLGPLILCAEASDEKVREQSLIAVGKYISAGGKFIGEVNQLVRRRLADSSDTVRIQATRLFRKMFVRNDPLVANSGDITTLFDIGLKDSSTACKFNATFALAFMLIYGRYKFSEKERFNIRALCKLFTGMNVPHKQGMRIISEASVLLDQEFQQKRELATGSLSPADLPAVALLLDAEGLVIDQQAFGLKKLQAQVDLLELELVRVRGELKSRTIEVDNEKKIRNQAEQALDKALSEITLLKQASFNKLALRGTLTAVQLCIPQLRYFDLAGEVFDIVKQISAN